MDTPRHEPVLLAEVLALLQPSRGGVFVDATLGLGGHAEALLLASPALRLVGIDRDPEALALARDRLAPFGDRLVTVHGRHEEIARHLDDLGIRSVDGVLADLGVSSLQLDRPERGFSFMRDGPLDMRMDRDGRTAADLVASLSAEELFRVFRDYGEEPRAGAVARAIVEAREKAPIRTTGELQRIVAKAAGRQEKGRNPATRVFQALRIATNREIVELHRFLDDTIERLALGGRLAVLSYHSLEDRTVKATFVEGAASCSCPPSFPVCVCSRRRVLELLTRKPLRPSDEEVQRNPRSRSARLRAAEKVAPVR
jgi:16S rRNA (cytosine1402-N4)-methyltransferase